ncbi:hypothetical protein IPC508_29420 [Pseudomonas aeruginosa]|nr:hypothetical protein ATC05_28310 [Pseudomonas aeruginosa]KSN93744.1 hypothetical protein APA98_15745 [Pseudomonas aeruginosa]RPZ95787.1 hypothetical protein IPC506_30170 [Pseudomonas aeruginosa]RQA08083.1 hypothetical protein IPC508_29420 [Pseudomonas aeruginosa]
MTGSVQVPTTEINNALQRLLATLAMIAYQPFILCTCFNRVLPPQISLITIRYRDSRAKRTQFLLFISNGLFQKAID